MAEGMLVIYRGLPGCGKTTDAFACREQSGGRVVGRDHLRSLLGIDGFGTHLEEDRVTDLQTQLIREGLRRGEDVYVDDMNLRSKYVTRLIRIALEESATWCIADMTYVLPQVCIQQDGDRERSVGEDVIIDLYERGVGSAE